MTVTTEAPRMVTIGKDFIVAGNATFTLTGRDTRFTFKVTRKDPEPGSRYTQPTFFVALMTGSDNESDYSYLGLLDVRTGQVRLTKGSRMTAAAPAVKAIQWALPLIWANAAMPPSFGITHEGKCGRCGRKLTVPESVLSGFGPECIGKLGGAAPQADRGGDFDGTLDYNEARMTKPHLFDTGSEL